MGRKAAAIYVNSRNDCWFGSQPDLDRNLTEKVANQLGLGNWVVAGSEVDFFEGNDFPASGQFVLGVYPEAAVFADSDLIPGSITERPTTIIQKFLEIFPDSQMLIIEVIETVNRFGYAFYEHGKLKRAYGGNIDDGVVIDVGEILPAERAYFESSKMRDGERYFRGEFDQWFNAPAFGSYLVSKMEQLFTGHPGKVTEYLPVLEFKKS